MNKRIPFAMNPVAGIEIMAVLFDDMVAAQPLEDVPTMGLETHFCFPFCPATAIFGTTAVPVNTARNNIADCAGMDAFNPLTKTVFVPSLVTGANGQSFFFSDFVCLHTAAVSFGINAPGLFHEYVFPFFDGIGIMNGMKAGRRAYQHKVGKFRNSFEIIESAENVVSRHINFVLEFFLKIILAEVLPCCFCTFFIDITEGDDFDVAAGIETIAECSGASTAATDESNFDNIGPGSVHGGSG
jgi:hypothetical protein